MLSRKTVGMLLTILLPLCAGLIARRITQAMSQDDDLFLKKCVRIICQVAVEAVQDLNQHPAWQPP